MTLSLLNDVIPFFERIDETQLWSHEKLNHVCDDLQRELSLQLFVRIRPEHRRKFDKPFLGWESIVKIFVDAEGDIEEMNKCFALCRYTAAMFHATRVAEWGAIKLGERIGVTDHKKGWSATCNQLARLVKDGYQNKPAYVGLEFDFLLQINQEIDTMKLAWRHKIDHVDGHLSIVPNAEFAPDIAEHIIGSVRVFMLRLADELKKSENQNLNRTV